MVVHAARNPIPQRIASLSDSVFGVGMTLLAYDVNLPKGGTLAESLAEVGPHIYALALSFGIAAAYWVTQQRRLALLAEGTGRGASAELLMLFAVVLLPITTRAIVTNSAGCEVLYGANLAALSCINAALLFWATWSSRHTPHAYKVDLALAVGASVFFLVTFAVSFDFPVLVKKLWFVGIVTPVLREVLHRRTVGAAEAAP